MVPELGLVFAWVPALDAWVGQTEVTNEAFRRSNPQHASGVSDSVSLDGAEQPAVQITFNDAVGFAERLTEQERKACRLPKEYTYRLLSSSEWTLCAQCGSGYRYPWGNSWPPKCGNYGDATRRRQLGYGFEDYDDHCLVSAPVGSNGTNAWGLCDLGGNVREWTCAANQREAVRDSSWRTLETNEVECVFTLPLPPSTKKKNDIGMRLILAKPVQP